VAFAAGRLSHILDHLVGQDWRKTMDSDSNCIFCKIIAGEIPCFKLFEDEATLAFMDINPASEGHALVIPKEHSADVHAVSDTAISETVRTAKVIAAAIDKTLSPAGINLLQANGPAAAQSVLHFHMHVLPRREGDELKLNWGLVPGDMDAIGDLAQRIRNNL
jgi:histidine triad (HIT) family protein